MDFLKALLGRTFAWLQALGVGALGALYAYLSTASPSTGDPIDSMITGAILSLIVKIVGTIVSRFPAKPV